MEITMMSKNRRKWLSSLPNLAQWRIDRTAFMGEGW